MRARMWLLLGASLPALAQAAQADGVLAAPARSPFWQQLTDPSYARASQLLRQGRAQLYPALGLGLLLGPVAAQQRRMAVEAALLRLERAVALAPDLLEARLLYGKALASWEERLPSGESVSRSREAVAQLEQLRALDPLYEGQEVAFQLGLLYTRAGDFPRAASEYERALALLVDDDDEAALLGNLAEVTMMHGDLTRALALYERSVRTGEGGGRLLALWGTAIALDRLGERARALEQARRALTEDRAPFAVLRQSGVFFVPAHELYYYEALGSLALADAERAGSEPLSATVTRARGWLLAAENRAALRELERPLRELEDGAARPFVQPFAARLARARPGRPLRAPSRAEGGSLPASEGSALPAAPEARVVLWALRALAGFERYLELDGGAGPFAEDAREHVEELAGALKGP